MTLTRLPPLSALRAFAAAARRESFRDAAAELGVTPSAVSHQIRILETELGAALFERAPRRVTLTAAGRALALETERAFAILADAVERTRAPSERRMLKISALALFTNAWLIPHLGRFEASHPGIAIAVETSNRVVDLLTEDVDIAIRNVARGELGIVNHKLIDLSAVALCAPEIAAGLKSPADLVGATLIHLSVGHHGWSDWLAEQGAASLTPRGALTVDTMPLALEAAVQGRGVMLGLAPIVFDAPAARSLVVPFASAPFGAGSYYLAHRDSDRFRPEVRAFVDWIRAELAADRPRLVRLAAARSANCLE